MGTPSKEALARILIVDDERHIRAAVLHALSLAGYQTEEAESGQAALRLLQDTHYDLMVLDMRMPEMDGIEVMQRARQLSPDLLIIILTGHATVESAIAAVKSDAVDYLLKPASIHDIVSTVANALQARAEQVQRQHLLHVMGETMDMLRQTQMPVAVPPSVDHQPERFMQVGALTLDRVKRLVITSGVQPRTINLTEGEAAIMIQFMEQPDQVLSCRQLARSTWEYDLDEHEAQSLIHPYIFRLRRKIETDPNHPQLICTIRSRGYLLATTQK
jgi:DNA-binding response OmpR family regulator